MKGQRCALAKLGQHMVWCDIVKAAARLEETSTRGGSLGRDNIPAETHQKHVGAEIADGTMCCLKT